MISLIVGLGNPGDEYKKTRHNAGFLLLDDVAKNLGTSFAYDEKFKAEVAKGVIADKPIHMVKPQMYMNKSGFPISAYANYFNIPAEELLVVHDDLDLEPGVVRLKKGGGHGGHNGLRDAISHLAKKDFYRLRIGIGHPGDKNKVSAFVLKAPSKSDQEKIEAVFYNVINELAAICSGEIQEAMKRLHT
ncbi:MAG: aminoacyl-tRNA hydrolase [Cycloclasticus sp.]|nr:MAG: aminoacyl-tRNA hydrolase [Cycloclasticus sp.]